ncbi:MAG TPA: ribosomal protein L7/L12, partial [Nannocystis sp.]
ESTHVVIKRDLPSHEAVALQRELMALGAEVEVRAQEETPVPPPAPRPTAAVVDILLKDCGPKKISVIKLIRELTYLGLKEAKDLAETAGSTVKSGVPRAEAEEIERRFAAEGAVVELRPSPEEVAEARQAEAEREASLPPLVDVYLLSYGANKILAIKEVRALTGLGLKETKDLVEAAPCLVKAQVERAVALQFERTVAEFGGKVELRG